MKLDGHLIECTVAMEFLPMASKTLRPVMAPEVLGNERTDWGGGGVRGS